MTPDNIKRAASLFLEARRTRRWLNALPEGCRPTDVDEAHEIQRLVFADALFLVASGGPQLPSVVDEAVLRALGPQGLHINVVRAASSTMARLSLP
jgi:hypothetical protein